MEAPTGGGGGGVGGSGSGRGSGAQGERQKQRRAEWEARALGLELGTRVECRYGRSENYYWGKINWINDNGTFDVLYEDGDQEFGLERNVFRIDPGLKVGDVVEARSDDDNRFWRVCMCVKENSVI